MDRRGYLIVIPLLCLGFLILSAFNWTHSKGLDPESVCLQPKKLVPHSKFAPASQFFDASYTNKSAELLGGAVRIPTQSFDDMGSPHTDPRYAPFDDLHEYLLTQFPLAAKHGKVEKVNKYGLLYTFKGAAASHVLKPALFMAHLDVVPVNNDTVDQWTHGPFSGYYDGEWLYGRGAGDTKNTVVGILEAIESLLEQNWSPARTIVVAFGYDEEIGGFRGAGQLSQKLLSRYGKDSFELILDEGFGNFEQNGVRLACPLVTERGYLDINFQIDTPGGHSSIAPDHTSIGMMSELIVQLEDNAFTPGIKDWTTHPAVGMVQCIAKYSPTLGTSDKQRFLDLDKHGNLDELVEFITDKGGATQFMVRTSQAVDIIKGGVKINALPETVLAKANYRVSIDSTVAQVYKHVEQLAAEMINEFDLGLISNGTILASGAGGNLTIGIDRGLEAAPISPSSGKQWNLLGGTMLHIFEDYKPRDYPLAIAPSMMTGNTDTRHYWDLSKHIYRYTPVDWDDMLNYHTVNEKLGFDSHLSTVAFFYELIQNLQE